jgi:uncharacterized protein with HEPN domain
MRRDSRALLADAQDAVRHILEFVRDRDLDDYLGDAMLRSAVERQFEILGEALRRLRLVDPELTDRIPDLRRIIDFRNILAHGYEVIDDVLVWRTIRDDVPSLESLLSSLLESI